MMNAIDRLARFMAIVGGLALSLLVVVTCVSVLGRGVNSFAHSDLLGAVSVSFADWLVGTGVGPLKGDFEIVEAGVAFTIFAFLPLCQFYSAHATVDIFTSALPTGLNRVIRAFWEIILSGMILLITIQLFAGMESKYRYGETTFLLQFPVWWGYAASFGAALVASVVAVYCAFARIAEAITGRHYLPFEQGASH